MRDYELKLPPAREISTVYFELSEDDVYRMRLVEFKKGFAENLEKRMTGLMRISEAESQKMHFNFKVIQENDAVCFRVAGNLSDFIELVKAYENILSQDVISAIAQDAKASTIISNSKSYRAPRNVKFGTVTEGVVSERDAANELATELSKTLTTLSAEDQKEIISQLKKQVPVVKEHSAPRRGFFSCGSRK